MISYKVQDKNILADAEQIPVYGEYDVVVVGGGMAGVGAALGAVCK